MTQWKGIACEHVLLDVFLNVFYLDNTIISMQPLGFEALQHTNQVRSFDVRRVPHDVRCLPGGL
jgi:hypothetical protein